MRFTEWQEVPHWTLDQHEHRQELTKIIHGATEAVSAKKIKPMKPYVTEEILEVSAHRARLIKSKSREEKQAKCFDQQRFIVAWKEITHWIAGHRRPTHELLMFFAEFQSRICQRLPDTNVYQLLWHKALKAKAKAGKAEVALRGYQRIQRSNLKEALAKYLASLIKQAATVSVDWWDKLKPLRIGTKGKKVPQIPQAHSRARGRIWNAIRNSHQSSRWLGQVLRSD